MGASMNQMQALQLSGYIGARQDFGLGSILSQANARAAELRSTIAALPSLQKELEALERMIAAAEGKKAPPCEVCGGTHD